jgi:hypothetical protein
MSKAPIPADRYVPTFQDIEDMSYDELVKWQTTLKLRTGSIRSQIFAQTEENEWSPKARKSLMYCEGALSAVNTRVLLENRRNTTNDAFDVDAPGRQVMFDSLKLVKASLETACVMYTAAVNLLEDDNDTNWAALENAVSRWGN